MTDRPLRRTVLAHLDAPGNRHRMTARIAGGGRSAPLTDPGLRAEAR